MSLLNAAATPAHYTLSLHDALPIFALHLKRDTTARTFRFDRAELPLPAMAQSWLIARGCPEAEILLTEELGTTPADAATRDRKSTRLNSSHSQISYAVFCLKTKNKN